MNRQKLRLGLLQAAIAIAMLTGAVAPALGSGQTKIVSMTRSMAVFLTLERDLANAVASHEQATTDALLAEEFELRLASNPTEPTVREDWLQLAPSGIVGNIGQLSVHDHGDLAIASFIKAIPASADKSRLLRTYVIDVWRKQGESWQLITRYQSELPTAEAPTEDIAPTGKG